MVCNIPQEKAANKNRTKINRDGLVEYTKAFEKIVLKELGKMAP